MAGVPTAGSPVGMDGLEVGSIIVVSFSGKAEQEKGRTPYKVRPRCQARVIASLRWHYPGQVMRVVPRGTLSLGGPPSWRVDPTRVRHGRTRTDTDRHGPEGSRLRVSRP